MCLSSSSTGPNKKPLIPQVLEFGRKFIDSKQHQLSLHAVAEVTKVSKQFPLRQDSHAHASLQEATDQRPLPSAQVGLGT